MTVLAMKSEEVEVYSNSLYVDRDDTTLIQPETLFNKEDKNDTVLYFSKEKVIVVGYIETHIIEGIKRVTVACKSVHSKKESQELLYKVCVVNTYDTKQFPKRLIHKKASSCPIVPYTNKYKPTSPNEQILS